MPYKSIRNSLCLTPGWLTLGEFCRRHQVNYQTALSAHHTKQFEGARIGGQYCVKEQSALVWAGPRKALETFLATARRA
jgi:hypothetical protein